MSAKSWAMFISSAIEGSIFCEGLIVEELLVTFAELEMDTELFFIVLSAKAGAEFNTEKVNRVIIRVFRFELAIYKL